MQLHYPLNPTTGLEDQTQLPWQNGVPSTGQEGSYPPFALCTEPMTELFNLITLAGLTGASSDLNQVTRAIRGGQLDFDATDSGTADALVAQVGLAHSAVIAGLPFTLIKGASPNATTTPTLTITDLSGNNPISGTIVKNNGSAVAKADLPANALLTFRAISSNKFALVSLLTVSDILALIPTNGGIISVVDTAGASTANALVGTAQPGISAYAARQLFLCTASGAANTSTAVTLNVTGSAGTPLGPLTLVTSTGAAPAVSDIQANASFLAMADGAGHARILGFRPSDVLTIVAAIYAVRIRLTANLNLYVATTGSDTANTGLTLGSPFATLQKAYNYLQQTYDLSGYTATINVAAGTYGAGVVAANPVAGQTSAGSVVFNGNTSNPASVYINVAGSSCFSAFAGANFAVQGFQLNGSGSGQGQGSGLYAQGGIIIHSSNIFLNFTQYQIFAQLGSVTSYGPTTLNGSAMSAFQAQGYGTVNINSYPVNFGGGTYSIAVANAVGGFISAGGTTFTGTAGGQRYRSLNSGNIQTNGGGPNAIPGTSAGTVDSTSSYG